MGLKQPHPSVRGSLPGRERTCRAVPIHVRADDGLTRGAGPQLKGGLIRRLEPGTYGSHPSIDPQSRPVSASVSPPHPGAVAKPETRGRVARSHFQG